MREEIWQHRHELIFLLESGSKIVKENGGARFTDFDSLRKDFV